MASTRPEHSDQAFGSRPFRPCSYFSVSHTPDSAEQEALLNCLAVLKAGDFSAVENCGALIQSKDPDIRQYAAQLYASACNHQQIGPLAKALDHLEDSDLERLILHLGHTLSPRGLIEILNFREDLDDDFLDETIHCALAYQMGERLPDTDPRIVPVQIRRAVDEMQAEAPNAYFYKGKPVFLGEVAERLLTKVAQSSRRDIELFGEAQILQDFSALKCPIDSGSFIACETMDEVFAYLKSVGQACEWTPGFKYFWGKPVPSCPRG